MARASALRSDFTGTELGAMGMRKLSTRPNHHAQAPQAIETFKKTSSPRWQGWRPTKALASMP